MPFLNTQFRCVISWPFRLRAGSVIVCYCLLAGCIAGSPATAVGLPAPATAATLPVDAPVTIGVLDAGWHTGVMLPADKLGPPLDELRRRFPHAKYLELGWGNRHFYMTTRPDIGMAIAALFPSRSAVYVQAYQHNPGAAGTSIEAVHWLCVSGAGFRKLQAYVGDSFQKDRRGELVGLQAEVAPPSEFFASTQSYDAFHTCNTWTATALHTAGLPVADRGVIFARQVMSEIRPLRACAGATL